MPQRPPHAEMVCHNSVLSAANLVRQSDFAWGSWRRWRESIPGQDPAGVRIGDLKAAQRRPTPFGVGYQQFHQNGEKGRLAVPTMIYFSLWRLVPAKALRTE